MSVIISGDNGISDVDGSAGTPAIRGTDANTGIFFGADQVGIATNGVERVEFGNSETVFNDGGADVDFRVEGDTDANLLFVDASTDRVGIGTSSPASPLHVSRDSSTAYNAGNTIAAPEALRIANPNTGSGVAATILFNAVGGGGGNGLATISAISTGTGSNALGFGTRDAGGSVEERARITSGGDFLVGTTTSSVTTEQGIVLQPTQGYLANNSTTLSGQSLILLYSSFSTADQTKFEVTSEGNVKSRTNSYAGFSDERLKQGITPASSQWSDIKNIEVVKFQMKSEQFSDEENPWMLGVVAQQVEGISPGLVEDDPKDGMKIVKYSILYMKAVKALQEAMERIETLEAKVAALEAK